MRGTCVDKNGVKKGAWTEEEDNKLRAYILRYGHWNWRLLPKFAGLDRCGKSCRLRWVNYLKPGIRRGNYSKEEEALIAKLHDELGNKWAAIAEKLPGRTDNEIKNYWHTHLNKRPTAKRVCNKTSKQDSLTFPIPILESSGSDLDSASSSRSTGEIQTSSLSELELPDLAETLGILHDHWNEEAVSSSFDGFDGSFWTEPFQVDTSDSDYQEIFSQFDQDGDFCLW